jgi:hypothetical protein
MADVREERLDDRRARLRLLLARPDGILFSEHHAGDGEVTRVPDGTGGDRVEATGLVLPVRAEQELAPGVNRPFDRFFIALTDPGQSPLPAVERWAGRACRTIPPIGAAPLSCWQAPRA